jgi:TonB family protein
MRLLQSEAETRIAEIRIEDKPEDTAETQPCPTSHRTHVPQLLVDLPSWPRVFFANLRDLVLPRRLPALELRSAPAPFWHDVFVERGLPWRALFNSSVCHIIACALLVALARLLSLQPHVVATPAFDRSQVIYYTASQYLPPLDTRDAQTDSPQQADPELSRQPIISVPREPDNRSQTIVTPPDVKLSEDIALPNIVAWSKKIEKPLLAVPPAPLTLAADVTRIAPQLKSVVAPPPDASRLTLRNQPNLQTQIVTPPPAVATDHRPLGELNISRPSVIAPAPSLPIAEQRAVSAVRSTNAPSQVVPPPPSVAASGSFGSRGRMIALNLRPSVAAPPTPPSGNRRGMFAGTPAGHPGASGSPGSTAGTDAHGTSKDGSESNQKGAGDLPAGLYVGRAPASEKATTGPVAGDATHAANSVNPNLLASLRPPRVSTSSRPTQPESAAKLSAPERAVFGDRKIYSLTLNMPNLNSAGGSWVIRFAELEPESGNSDSTNHGSNSNGENRSAADLSQPQAVRKVDPAYPLELMRENVAGTVILYAVIRSNGTVGNIHVLRGVDTRLDQYAIEAISQWKFNPATRNGSPVDVEATFQIPFKPSRVGTNF